MASNHCLSGLLCTCILLLHLSTTSCAKSRHFTSQAGKRFDGNLDYFEWVSMSKLQCSAACAANESCVSASYRSEDGACRLSVYDVNTPENGQEFLDGSAWSALSKSVCPDGWLKLGDVCYLLIKEIQNFNTAKQRCVQEGGMLAEPRTTAAHELLSNYMEQHVGYGERYWIGMTGYHDSGYRWVSDNSPISYTAWGPGEPDGVSGCILYDKAPQYYRWADDRCHNTNYVVCQSEFVFA